MINLSTFYNNKFEFNGSKISSVGEGLARLGDWCLTPVRCLFDGNSVEIADTLNRETKIVKHTKQYGDKYSEEKKTLFTVIKSIFTLVFGLFFGTLLKGLSYLSSEVREKHHLAVKHFTPKEIVIGSATERLNLETITQRLQKEYKNNSFLNQKISSITLYVDPKTTLPENFFDSLDFKSDLTQYLPQKIILIGEQFAYNFNKLRGYDKYWETSNELEKMRVYFLLK